MSLPLPLLRSITRYLGEESHKVIFLNNQTLKASNDDLFIWTNIYMKQSFRVACLMGNLQWIKHLYYYGYESEWNVMDLASKNGHLGIVKWLHQHRSEGCTGDAMDWAAGKGHLHVIEWLHQNRTEGCTSEALRIAKGRKHMKIVEWLKKNRSEDIQKAKVYKAKTSYNFNYRIKDIIAYLHSIQ